MGPVFDSRSMQEISILLHHDISIMFCCVGESCGPVCRIGNFSGRLSDDGDFFGSEVHGSGCASSASA